MSKTRDHVYVRLLESDFKIAGGVSGFTDFEFGFKTTTKISLVRLHYL